MPRLKPGMTTLPAHAIFPSRFIHAAITRKKSLRKHNGGAGQGDVLSLVEILRKIEPRFAA
jgi:hypothetical protein